MQSHTMSKGQKMAVLILGLLWATAAVTSYLIYDGTRGFGQDWYIVILISLLFLVIGLTMTSGRGRALIFLTFWPFIMTYECLSRYNVERVLLAVGMVYATAACALLFILVSSFVTLIVIGFTVVIYLGVCICVLVSKRFRADAQHR